MVWTKSQVFSSYAHDALQGIQLFKIGAGGDTQKLALYSTAVVTATSQDDTSVHNAYNGTGGQWVLANEITGTNWSAGGVTLGTPILSALGAVAGRTTYDASDVSVANTTLTGAVGALIYDSTAATVVANQGICAIWFGGTSYTTVAGTLGITWDALGIWYWQNAP